MPNTTKFQLFVLTMIVALDKNRQLSDETAGQITLFKGWMQQMSTR